MRTPVDPVATAREVILVEDDDGLRQAVERLLVAAGYEVESFSSAEAFLDSPARSGVACLIADVRLPGMSGFELRERLVHEGSRPAVVYVTAHDDARARARAERDGALAFLLKPFEGRRLLDLVEQAVGARNGT
jgi:FixJ family two-component response regulator